MIVMKKGKGKVKVGDPIILDKPKKLNRMYNLADALINAV